MFLTDPKGREYTWAWESTEKAIQMPPGVKANSFLDSLSVLASDFALLLSILLLHPYFSVDLFLFLSKPKVQVL